MNVIINLTPHVVSVVSETGSIVAEYPSMGVARATQSDSPCGTLEGIPLVRSEFGVVEGLPEFVSGTWYVVSAITATAARTEGRTTEDLLLTSGPVRDADGRIVGCRAFALV